MADKHSVLIVEDDLDVAEMLEAYFRGQGYGIQTVNWGEDALAACQDAVPDLILLDIRLPDIDGYEVARRLRLNRRTEKTPIIFLTERRQRDDRLRGLELGADDYITKPFDIQELRLRVRNALRRAVQGSLNNPITKLPEGDALDERLDGLLAGGQEWGVLQIALENLDPFREQYGFVAADDVLRAIGVMIQNSLRESGSQAELLGHLETTRFVVGGPPVRLAELEPLLRQRLSQSLEYFYPAKDRMPGFNMAGRMAIHTRLFAKGHTARIKNPAELKSALLRQLAI